MFRGEKCIYFSQDTEHNCHFSMFVRRKCKEGACPNMGQFPDEGAETMFGRVIHAVTAGREGEWEDRDPKSPEKKQSSSGNQTPKEKAKNND